MKHPVAVSVEDTQTSHRAGNYSSWIKTTPQLEPHFLCFRNEMDLDRLRDFHALVLSGGSDLDPKFYGMPDHSKAEGVNPRRDDFEMKLIELALERKIPILGICRGLQIVNVFLGGNLIPDIEEEGYPSHRSIDHLIRISPGTHLYSQLGPDVLEINSTHHQAADQIGEKLMASAHSPDNIIEAMEWENKAEESFLLLVQWHPERLAFEHPASKNILTAFARAVQKIDPRGR